MRLHSFVVAVIVCLGAGACSAAKQTEFTRADMENIKRLTQEFAEAFNARDLAKVMSYYPDGAVFMPPNTSTLRGVESIEAFWKASWASGTTDLEMVAKDVGGHGPLAYASGTFTLKRRSEGQKESRDRGKYLVVLRNFGGQWRFEYTIWSSDLPQLPPATAPQ